MNVNLNTDFSLQMYLADNAGNVFVPAAYNDYKLTFYTSAKKYYAYKRTGNLHHCTENDDNSITVYFDNALFQEGDLNCEFTYYEDDKNYEIDGKAITSILNLDVKIVPGNGDSYIVYYSEILNTSYINTDAMSVLVNGTRIATTNNRCVVLDTIKSIVVDDAAATYMQVIAARLDENVSIDISNATSFVSKTSLNFMLKTLSEAGAGTLKMSRAQLYAADYAYLKTALENGYTLSDYDNLFYCETDTSVLINNTIYIPTNNKIIENLVVESISCSAGYTYSPSTMSFPAENLRTFYIQRKISESANLHSLNGMFAGNSYINEIDISAFKCDDITDAAFMFAFCQSLVKIALPQTLTNNLVSADGMFFEVGFNYMYVMLSQATAQIAHVTLTFSDNAFSKLTTGIGLFSYCCLDLSFGNNCFSIYTTKSESWLASFTTSLFDYSLAKNINFGVNAFLALADATNLFMNNVYLENLTLGANSFLSLTVMHTMFNNCQKLKNVDITTNTISNTFGLFADCASLTSVKISASGWNLTDSAADIFDRCTVLTSINLGGDALFNFAAANKFLSIANCPIILEADCNTLVNSLATSTVSPTLQVSTDTHNALTQFNLIAALTAKGWTVSEQQ